MGVLLLGDSHLAHFRSYPWLFARDCTVRAVNGEAASDLRDQADGLDLAVFDLIAISVGTNDCGIKPTALPDFLRYIEEIVVQASPVPVLMVNNPGADSRAAGADHELLMKYAAEAGALVRSHGGSVLDVTKVIAPLGARGRTADGLHVSKWGYLLLFPALRRAVWRAMRGKY